MGEVLREHPKRKELHHIIKVPVPDFDDGGKFDSGKFRLRVEEALRDLHADRIAVLQHLQRANPNADDLRIPNIEAVHEPMMEVFERLKEEGKVCFLTTFPYTPWVCVSGYENRNFQRDGGLLQPDRDRDGGIFFQACKRKARGSSAFGPLWPVCLRIDGLTARNCRKVIACWQKAGGRPMKGWRF